MIMLQYRDCPGCGAHLPASDAPADERYHASAECWQLYGELVGYTVMRGDTDFIHQLAVDTYGAQHARAGGRPIGLAFALIGLHLACDKGYSGRQVQHMHTLLAQRTKTWPPFTPPRQLGALTVLDVMQAQPGEPRDAMLRQWGQSVWDAWSEQHDHVKALLERVMSD